MAVGCCCARAFHASISPIDFAHPCHDRRSPVPCRARPGVEIGRQAGFRFQCPSDVRVRVSPWAPFFASRPAVASARMVKQVDTGDLKSPGPNPAVPVRFRLRAPEFIGISVLVFRSISCQVGLFVDKSRQDKPGGLSGDSGFFSRRCWRFGNLCRPR